MVTGGSTGIGAAICRRLLQSGMRVISLARRPAGFEAEGLVSVCVDLSDPHATREAALELAGREPATVIVHNAGAILERPVEEASIEDLEILSSLHLAAPLSLLQANLAAMRGAGSGRVVLVSSRAVLGLARRTAYASTKAGMLGMARTWALELGPSGVTVNVVAPGPIAETEMFDGVVPVGDPRREQLAHSIPVRRLGSPEDVARAVDFFVQPEASFLTGQVLYVCGGTSVGSLVL